MNLVRLLALLIYTYGAFSFGAILILWLAQMGRIRWGGKAIQSCAWKPRSDLVGGALTFLSFSWFVCCLLLVLIQLDPKIRAYPIMTVLFVQVFLFPPLIAHTTYIEVKSSADAAIPRVWRWALVALYAGCLSVMSYSLLGFYDVISLPHERVGTISGVSMGIFFSLAGVYSVLAISRYSRKPTTPKERSSRRWWLGLFISLFLMGLPIILINLGWLGFGELVEVGLRSLPLAFLFAGTYFGNRFEFFDVFIKRGLALLVSIILLTIYFVLVPPSLEGLPLAWARPWVYALTLLPLVMGLPWIYGKLSAWLDHVWLGRQFRTVEAVKHFLSGIQSAISQEDLVREAETRIGEIFHASVRIQLREAVAREALSEAVLNIPVPGSDGPAGSLHLGPRANQIPYFGQDVILLESLSEVFASILENVRLQARKQEQEQREKELSLHASRSELKALRAQINPHFLFNALNAIAGLIPKDPERADRAVEQLAEVFRYTLRRSESEWTRLGDEMEAIRAYLDLEQARFGQRLQCRVAVEPAVEDARIPTLVVQTLVENAVKHGVAAIRGPGHIEVEARLQGEFVAIQVSDNGPGFRPGADSQASRPGDNSGFGLKNIRDRLHGHYGAQASLEVSRDPGGRMTVVTLKIPRATAGREEGTEAGTPEPVEARPTEGAAREPAKLTP
jgi:signal transduction histidine kinase